MKWKRFSVRGLFFMTYVSTSEHKVHYVFASVSVIIGISVEFKNFDSRMVYLSKAKLSA